MKKLIYLLVALGCNTFFLTAQSIEMELLNPQPFLQGSDTGDMEFADLDGDGDMDLIITGSGNMSDGNAHGALTTLYFNDGAGNFNAVNNHGIENIRVSKIALADIDADDDLDLMISGSTNGGTPFTKLYSNDGGGNFTEVVNTIFESLEGGYFNFGDIDGDTDQDIIYSGNDIFDVVAFINDGTGNYSLSSNIGVTNIGGVLELFDADGDNDLDILIMGVDQDDEVVTDLYENDGAGGYTIVNNAGFNPLSFGDIAIGDTDGDGDNDVFIMGWRGSADIESEFYTSNGDGTFTLVEDVPFIDLGVGGETSFNDFDNDGDLDVFIIGAAEGGLPNIYSHIYENLGSNNFILSDEFTGAYLSTHAVADIDGDALLDVVIGGTTTGNPVRGSFMYKNISTLGINDETISTNVSMYPNPSNGNLNIDILDLNQVSFELYNTIGQRILSKSLGLGLNNLQLSLSNGIYLAKIDSQGKSYIQKLVIHN